MKVKEIQDLIDFISKSGLNEVKIETEQLKLAIKKCADIETVSVTSAPADPAPVAAPAAAPAATPAAPAPAAPEANNYITIKSPMIGTFYRSENPESPMFVNIGDSVSVGSTVCIIEAMKLFNEIESEVSGKVVEILVENASPVEYDQPLFVIDPS